MIGEELPLVREGGNDHDKCNPDEGWLRCWQRAVVNVKKLTHLPV